MKRRTFLGSVAALSVFPLRRKRFPAAKPRWKWIRHEKECWWRRASDEESEYILAYFRKWEAHVTLAPDEWHPLFGTVTLCNSAPFLGVPAGCLRLASISWTRKGGMRDAVVTLCEEEPWTASERLDFNTLFRGRHEIAQNLPAKEGGKRRLLISVQSKTVLKENQCDTD